MVGYVRRGSQSVENKESILTQPEVPGETDSTKPPAAHGLKTHGSQSVPAASVPVFSCLVYVSPQVGGVRARVANLAGIEFTASSERAALGKIVPAFKARMIELMQSGAPIEWIEPPMPIEPGEQKRFVPVHL